MNITIKYGTGNQTTATFDPGTTIEQVLNNGTVRGALGYGKNVEAHIAGVPQPGDNTIREGDVISVFDKQCSKAAGPGVDHVSITGALGAGGGAVSIDTNGETVIRIQYGTGNETEHTFPEGTTLQDALKDAAVRGELGFGTSVEGYIGGVPQPEDTVLKTGDTVKVHDKQCSKAADGGPVKVRIEYGTGRVTVRTFPVGTTVEQVLADPAVRGELGFGTTVEGHIGGVPQPATTTVTDGTTVKVHDKQCSKASK